MTWDDVAVALILGAVGLPVITVVIIDIVAWARGQQPWRPR